MSDPNLPALPTPARLAGRDLVREGLLGVRGRPLRAALSALGISIGVAAMVAVLGIGAASRAELLEQIDRLGTNLLTVQAGQTLFGENTQLPAESITMVARIPAVRSVSAVGTVPGATVRRTDRIPAQESGGIAVLATRLDLLGTLDGTMRSGDFLTPATAEYPAVALGAVAALRLGVDQPGIRVYVGGHWFVVSGVLDPVAFAPEIDRAVLIGWPIAQRLFDFDGHPSRLYERSADEDVRTVQELLGRTVNPENPQDVAVSRPSDALTAQLAAKSTFNGLFLGLGAVALLVGGVGVANTMVISVLERRQEIGLRRAIGASRRQVRLQFLTESIVLSLLGGTVGVLLGVGISLGYAISRGWPTTLPGQALLGGVLASIVIGALAGLYPARRAARLAPTEALSS
ncbi:ABC transporter permease [Plantactinospora soyae]|uniref:ABC transport system permease protein n=1 Tax=Plantactinospora soyae TaxID=1544732 RepID=A0A927R177_9ACTN|nr:ABC transporter permease [Plantactinospora soyae]MBE1491057.1 putative ABC transport system permease protein [Plantactinospora soyae]